MEMPPGNVVVPEKMQFSSEILPPPYHCQWVPDERDGFILWLRGEFAAANAIIDSLCQHLRLIGDPGEYGEVIKSIQNRRMNWNPILHMQQFYPVTDVQNELQQVTWRRQQSKGPVREFKRNGPGYRQGQQRGYNSNKFNGNGVENVVGSEKGERVIENGEETNVVILDDKRDEDDENHQDVSCDKRSGDSQGITSRNSDCQGSCNVPAEKCSHSTPNPSKKQNQRVPKTFVGNEIVDGKAVNVVDGLKLYDELFNASEVAKIVSLVNDMRAAGKRGQFQGQTFVLSKRPFRGHGREIIQLGLPIADAPAEEINGTGIIKDKTREPIPSLLQDAIDRLVSTTDLSLKPDSCIIDIFNEGDHSQPHMWPSWYGRPVSVLFLTECEMTFGKIIGMDHPGDFRGSLRLSLQPGSLLVMQGKSADLAKHAIPSLWKQRILVTFTKSQPRKLSPAVASNPHWGPPQPSRSPSFIRHSTPKHYGPVPTNGVLPPVVSPQLGPPNGIHPIFVPPPIPAAVPFPPPVALPPRIPLPGTGVFLPPSGSGNSSSIIVTEACFSAELERDNGLVKPNESSNDCQKECNGSLDVAEPKADNK